MKLVIDSNRIISALIKDGLTRKILVSGKFDFYSLGYVLDEVNKYKDLIIKKSKLSEEQINLLFSLVLENINIIGDSIIKKHIKKSIKIMEDIDINDAPIIAAALSIDNDGIWTEDKHFEKQNEIKVWKTKDLRFF